MAAAYRQILTNSLTYRVAADSGAIGGIGERVPGHCITERTPSSTAEKR
jgi:hypothetical protein